jgi:hypothetical protein
MNFARIGCALGLMMAAATWTACSQDDNKYSGDARALAAGGSQHYQTET